MSATSYMIPFLYIKFCNIKVKITLKLMVLWDKWFHNFLREMVMYIFKKLFKK